MIGKEGINRKQLSYLYSTKTGIFVETNCVWTNRRITHSIATLKNMLVYKNKRFTFIRNSFKDDRKYFFDKNYGSFQLVKKIAFQDIEKNLSEDVVIVAFQKEFTFLINTIPNLLVNRIEAVYDSSNNKVIMSELLDLMAEQKVFLTDIYSLFSTVVYAEGDLSQDTFDFSVINNLEKESKQKRILKDTFFQKVRSFGKKESNFSKLIKLMTQSINFSPFKNSLLRRATFEVYKIIPDEKKYIIKDARATRHAPFTLNHEKAFKLRPSSNGLVLPELRNEEGKLVTEEIYQNVAKENIRYLPIAPAKVLQHDPFIVIVYSNTLDCVITLLFPPPIGKELQQRYKVNQELLSINGYRPVAVIANFITDEKDQVLINYFLANEIKKKEWLQLAMKNIDYRKKYAEKGYRIGLWIFSRYPTLGFMKTYFPEKLT